MKIYWPWSNLGCFGFSIGTYYFDFYLRPQPGFYINNHRTSRRWYRLFPFPKLLKTQEI